MTGTYYKVIDPWGNDRHHFVRIDGDTTAERQVLEYVEGSNNSVELWRTSLMLPDEKIRDVTVDELRDEVIA